MTIATILTLLTVCALPAAASAASGSSFQSRPANQTKPPASESGTITAKDGDTILVEGDAQIRVVRRRPAVVRVVFNAEQRWVLIIADYSAAGRSADGVVDMVYRFEGLNADWPFEARWEGEATLEEYWGLDRSGRGLGLRLPRGLVQLVDRPDAARDPSAVAVIAYQGSGTSAGQRLTFDAAEERAVPELARNATGSAAATGSSLTINAPIATARLSASADAPIRVGTAKKIYDVPATMPTAARRAGIFGIVILELTIDTDGTVKDARVLRSIPMLDDAAIEAARQWRYEPVLVNGQAVPATVTVTVPFQ